MADLWSDLPVNMEFWTRCETCVCQKYKYSTEAEESLSCIASSCSCMSGTVSLDGAGSRSGRSSMLRHRARERR
jgi:hypothetical protein